MSHIETQPLSGDLDSSIKKNKRREGFKDLKKTLFQNFSPRNPNSKESCSNLNEENDEIEIHRSSKFYLKCFNNLILDWKALKFSDEEHFEGDISFDILEEDLDEGYSYNNNISRPEHTPEIGLPLTERKKKDSPHKQELSQSISK